MKSSNGGAYSLKVVENLPKQTPIPRPQLPLSSIRILIFLGYPLYEKIKKKAISENKGKQCLAFKDSL